MGMLSRLAVAVNPRVSMRRIINMKALNNNYGLSLEDIASLAITPDLSTDMRDPRNARYLGPLPDAENEKLAHEMAAVSYSACADDCGDDTTQAEADQVYEQ